MSQRQNFVFLLIGLGLFTLTSATFTVDQRERALVFQLGACDIRRLGAPIGRLDDPDIARLQDMARRLQMLP